MTATATTPVPRYTSAGGAGPKYPHSDRVFCHQVPGWGTTRSAGPYRSKVPMDGHTGPERWAGPASSNQVG